MSSTNSVIGLELTGSAEAHDRLFPGALLSIDRVAPKRTPRLAQKAAMRARAWDMDLPVQVAIALGALQFVVAMVAP